MRIRVVVLLTFAVCLLSTSALAQGDYIIAGRPVPRGAAEAGRRAFRDLHCVSCHRVIAEHDLPPPLLSNPGPDLGGVQAAQSMSHLATSILVPSHTIS